MPSEFHQRIETTLAGGAIDTGRLIARPWTEDDAALMAEFFNADGGDFPNRYWYYDKAERPYDARKIEETVLPAMQDAYSRSVFEFYLFHKTDNRIIGQLEFQQDWKGRSRVSYYVSPSERRDGYAFEAYAACVNWAVDHDILSGELYAHTDPANAASQQFLLKAGFQQHAEVWSQHPSYPPGGLVVPFTRSLSKAHPLTAGGAEKAVDDATAQAATTRPPPPNCSP